MGKTALLTLAALLAVSSETFGARRLSPEENTELCERYGDTLERRFATNPQLLVTELDELIVKVGSKGPDRVNHDKSGRMLASIAPPPSKKVDRGEAAQRAGASLAFRVHLKLTEANKVLTQSKRLGFFDEDEERVTGVQDACAKAIHERASILEKMVRPE